MGGSASASKSKSKSKGKYSEDVWGDQSPYLQQLYRQAGSLFGNQDWGQFEDMAGNLDPYNKQLMDRGLGGQEQMLSGGSYGNTDDIRSKLMGYMGQPSQTGEMYKSIVGGEGNTYIDPMVDAMKRGSMENLDRMQSSAGLDATSAGQSGSSRHAMQNAMLARSANQDITDKEAMMRGGAYDTDLNMKLGIAEQADSNRQMEQDRLMQMLQGSDANVQSGMGASTGLQNLGMGSMAPWMQAYQQPWNAMGQYSSIIGGPLVLGSGSQRGNSKGTGVSGSASYKG